MIPTKYFLLSAITLSLFYMCSSPDDESSSPAPAIETFGAWGPAFADQTSNFQQTRTGSNGTVQTRDVTVTESSVSLDANERQDGIDLNNDGDSVDYYTITETTYSASIGGSFSETSFMITKDQEANFFTLNYGVFSNTDSGEIIPINIIDLYGDEYIGEGLIAYEILDDSFNVYRASPEYQTDCYTKVQSGVEIGGLTGELTLGPDFAVLDVYGLDPEPYLDQEEIDYLASIGITKVGMYYGMEFVEYQGKNVLLSLVDIYADSPDLVEEVSMITSLSYMVKNFDDISEMDGLICPSSSKSNQSNKIIYKKFKESFKNKKGDIKSIRIKPRKFLNKVLRK